MSNKKKLLVLIAILVILFLIIISTYSKYISEGDASVTPKIGQWIIKINEQDVTNGISEFEIDDFIWDWNNATHVKEPKVAPGMKGMFKLKIDPTGTDVSIKYTITIYKKVLTQLANINLKITGVTENGVKQKLKEDANGNVIIEKIKTLDKIQSANENDRIDNLEIEVTWENDDTDEGNKQDSIVGSIMNNKIKMPVTVNIIQYTGDN